MAPASRTLFVLFVFAQVSCCARQSASEPPATTAEMICGTWISEISGNRIEFRPDGILILHYDGNHYQRKYEVAADNLVLISAIDGPPQTEDVGICHLDSKSLTLFSGRYYFYTR
jgi:hypothetical protein